MRARKSRGSRRRWKARAEGRACESLPARLCGAVPTLETGGGFVRRVSDDEAASLRSQLEALRAQSQQDDAYKLQTMQYLRKYEGELQKKEVQLTELRTRLEQASGGASQET